MTPSGYDYRDVAEKCRRFGRIEVNQYDQHPRAIRFRRAVYRAVKAGLLKRVKSPPSRATYVHTGQETLS